MKRFVIGHDRFKDRQDITISIMSVMFPVKNPANGNNKNELGRDQCNK